MRGRLTARVLDESGCAQFDEQSLAEIESEDFPAERLICCRNPLVAAERAGRREDRSTTAVVTSTTDGWSSATDGQAETVRRRLVVCHREIEPLLRRYEEGGLLGRVGGSGRAR